jgi:hypothetical protein
LKKDINLLGFILQLKVKLNFSLLLFSLFLPYFAGFKFRVFAGAKISVFLSQNAEKGTLEWV